MVNGGHMEHFENLKKYLEGFLTLPPLEWLRLAKSLRIRSLEKGEFYIRQGEPVHELGFVIKGLLYNFYTNDKGQEFVKYFIPENNLVACYSSLLQDVPAVFSCQAWEPTTLVTLQYSELQKFYKAHSAWERIGRLSAEKLFIEMEKREQEFMMADAKTRYENLIKAKPGLPQRVPQYLIASYIGISPVSLSRIRAQDLSS